MTVNLALSVLLCFQSVAAFATQNHPRSLVYTSAISRPVPSDSVLAKWVERIFDDDDLWIFRDRQTFGKILDEVSLTSSQRSRLERLFRSDLTDQEWANAISWHSPVALAQHGFVSVPYDFWNELPPDLVRAVYRHEFVELGLEVGFDIWDSSEPKILKRLVEQHVSLEGLATFWRSLITVQNQPRLIIGPAVWRHLPFAEKAKLLRMILDPAPLNLGVRYQIQVTRTNIPELARLYAGERSLRDLIALLTERVDRSGRDSTWVRLEDFLHPFIQTHAWMFAEASGPNCYNTSLCVNLGVEIGVNHLSYLELLPRLFSRYRFVQPGEALRTGDLLLYVLPLENHQYTVEHASTYIHGGLVFSKSGASKFSPYVIQSKTANEELNFPKNNFKFMAFRLPRPGEHVIDEEGNYSRHQNVYYSERLSEAQDPARTPRPRNFCARLLERGIRKTKEVGGVQSEMHEH